MGSIDNSVSDRSHFDVLIIGAGVSGINAAYRIHTELPDYNYAVIESRGAVGGTWDLFRYPGIRFVSFLSA
jgi:monooxygenase